MERGFYLFFVSINTVNSETGYFNLDYNLRISLISDLRSIYVELLLIGLLLIDWVDFYLLT
jgi:hypothetical protein